MPRLGTLLKSIAFATALSVAGWAGYELTRPEYDGAAGIAYGQAFAPVRNKHIDFHIWYPAIPGGETVTVGGNGVFFGTPAGRNAPHRNGQFPLIVMSHGAGGNAGQFGWIAEQLATAGFVVVLPNHPGSTTGNASAKAAVRVWERPADLSAVLDEITLNPATYTFVDRTRIATLGFSAGGYSSLAISGARIDPDRLQRFCDHTDHGMSDCAFFAHFGIDLHAIDFSPASQDLRDPRVDAVVVVDPGIVSTLTNQSLATISVPMMVINLGDEETVPAGVYARHVAETVPGARYGIVPDAIHFSFLARCKAGGAAILRNEGEPDPLCDDAGGRSRSEIHAELTGLIVSYFREVL